MKLLIVFSQGIWLWLKCKILAYQRNATWKDVSNWWIWMWHTIWIYDMVSLISIFFDYALILNMADSFHNSGNILTVIQTGQVIMSVQSTTHLSLNSYWAKWEFCTLASSELGFQWCEEKRADSSRWLVPQKLRVSVCRGGSGHNAQSQF